MSDNRSIEERLLEAAAANMEHVTRLHRIRLLCTGLRVEVRGYDNVTVSWLEGQLAKIERIARGEE